MDSRLVLTVLLVTLSWMCLGTGVMAQNATGPMNNMTGPMNNMTGPMNNMTGPMNNMTGPMNNMTGPMNNMTGPMNNMTGTRPPMLNGMNNTTGPMNNMTGTRPPMLNGMNNTTGPMNNTTGTRPPVINGTTTAPPLRPNTTVEALTTTINRQECRRQQLCAAQPSDCDPSTSGSCFFLSVRRSSGRNFLFQLSGESVGYLAASLSPDGTAGANDTTYICANNNGSIKFFGAVLNNGQLTPVTLEVNQVRGRARGGIIQCTFAATVPGPTARATLTNFALSVSTGDFDAATDALGNPVTLLKTGVIDLSNPNSTVTNLISNATATNATATTATSSTSSPTTVAGGGVSLQQSLSQALLITLGVVGLALL